MSGDRPVVVSAANGPYYRCLLQLAASLRRHGCLERQRVVFWDLGLLEGQRVDFARRHPAIELRRFPFESYPSFVGFACDSGRPTRTSYAWKPILIADSLEGTPLLWLDSATVVLSPLERLFERIETCGAWLPFGGSGRIEEWIHPATVAYLRPDPAVLANRTRCATALGFAPSHPVVPELVRRWRELALVEECIAPRPSIERHRHDESILTLLLHQLEGDGRIAQTTDEIDLCTDRPIGEVTVRHKLSNETPLWLDPLLVLWYRFKRRADLVSRRLRRR